MLSFRKPDTESIRRFIAEQGLLPITYEGVGTTAQTPPTGYVVDHTRVKLGVGEPTFLAAISALKRWQQFQLSWVEAAPRETPLQTGQVVCVMGHAVGVWWINACRIVHVVDEVGPVKRFGFAYGTLPGHVESGEERFLIEWDRSEDSVWYDIMAFSRPKHALTWLGYPVVRRLQKRFARDSGQAMIEATKGSLLR